MTCVQLTWKVNTRQEKEKEKKTAGEKNQIPDVFSFTLRLEIINLKEIGQPRKKIHFTNLRQAAIGASTTRLKVVNISVATSCDTSQRRQVEN